jgi:hypothetical protein
MEVAMRWALGIVFGLIAAFFLLGAVGSGGSWPHGVEYDARERVRMTLRDGASAEFRNVRVHPGANEAEKAVCGEVNARNGFGGMGGWQRFIVLARRGESNQIQTAPAMLQEALRSTWNDLDLRHCRG